MINYHEFNWCLLQFEDALMKERDKHINFRNEDQRSLYMHFNRVDRITSAINYFSDKQELQNKHEHCQRVLTAILRQLIIISRKLIIKKL
jgi:hypothetical protein